MYSPWCSLLILSVVTFSSVLTFPTNVGIIGGYNTTIEHHPWLVSIWKDGARPWLVCHGFLVSDSWVVTIASTVIYHVTYIRAGSNSSTSGGVIAYIEKYILHADFDLGTFDSDIALLRLKNPIVGENIRSLALPDKNVSFASGDEFVVAGWGVTSETSSEPSETLKEVKIPAVTYEDCHKLYGSVVTENMICGGGVANKGPCDDDEGVPVLFNGLPVGLLSYFPRNCATPGYPVRYTNVLRFVDWIKESIKLQLF